MRHMKWSRIVCAIGVLLALVGSTTPTAAQGVTTAAATGVVKDAQGAVIPGATIVAVGRRLDDKPITEVDTDRHGRKWHHGQIDGRAHTVAEPGHADPR